ncbi:hypothetical protein [Clostridium sp. Marseille-Q7071]
MSIVTLILTTLIALPLGIASAIKPYSFKDKVLTILALIGISIPGFFIALLIIKIFAINLGWFPISGLSTVGKS